MEEGLSRSALWQRIRQSEEFNGRTDAEVYDEIVSRLKSELGRQPTTEQFKQMARISELLQMVPNILVSSRPKAILLGQRRYPALESHEEAHKTLTCTKCGITTMVASTDHFADFVIRHAGCE